MVGSKGQYYIVMRVGNEVCFEPVIDSPKLGFNAWCAIAILSYMCSSSDFYPVTCIVILELQINLNWAKVVNSRARFNN